MIVTKTETGELWEFPHARMFFLGAAGLVEMWIDENGETVFKPLTKKTVDLA